MKYSFMRNSIRQIGLSISCLLIFILIMKILDVENFGKILGFLILYSILICFIVIVSEIARQKRIKNLLLKFYKEMDYRLVDELSSELGEDYRFLIEKIFNNQKNLLSKYEFNRSELINYRDLIEKWAHDIKTPISGLSLVLENNKSVMDDNLYQKLYLSNQQIKTKLDIILYYARSTSSKKDYSMDLINLKEALDDALVEYYPIILEKELLVINNLVDTYVISDYNTLVFMISQIISNCVKYAESKVVFDIIATDEISFRISNDGSKPSDRDYAFLFDKSYTGTNSRRDDSTGLGLYLVKSFSDDLGIKIDPVKDDKFFMIDMIFTNPEQF